MSIIPVVYRPKQYIAAPTGPKNPWDVTGCVMWLESSKGVTKTGGSPDKVSQWDDVESGNTHNWTQTTDANRFEVVASTFGANDGFLADGTNDFMTRAHTTLLDLSMNSSWMLLVHLKTVTPFQTGTKGLFGKYGTHGYYPGWRDHGGNTRFALQGADAAGFYVSVATTTNIADGTIYTVEYTNNGAGDASGFDLVVNGVAQSVSIVFNTGTGDWTNTDPLDGLCARDNNLHANCYVACYGVWDNIPSASDRADIRTYINNNYT